jgi:hypothetical protein
VGPDPSLYNESLLVARGIRELELGVQESQENENWVQLSVGDKWVVEEELEDLVCD